MKSITIPVQKSPENFVRNYLVHRMGNNITIGKTTKNSDGTWTISLKATVPSYVKLRDNKSKTFVYVFDNIGKAIVKYDDYDYDFVDKPVAPDIDLVLIKKIEKLTESIQAEILDHGKYSWGKLPSIKFWLGSIHNIILRCLQENNFRADKFDKRYQRYYGFLESNKWIRHEDDERTQIIATNKLTKMHEKLVTEGGIKDDLNSVAETILGIIYSKNYYEIRDDLKIRGIGSHITTTKAYYADAVREGKPIPMTRESLWLNYRTYNYSPKPSRFKYFTFPKTIAELVTIGIFRQSDDHKYISADPELLEKLLPYQTQLAQNTSL